jgi:hypothetical protein
LKFLILRHALKCLPEFLEIAERLAASPGLQTACDALAIFPSSSNGNS